MFGVFKLNRYTYRVTKLLNHLPITCRSIAREFQGLEFSNINKIFFKNYNLIFKVMHLDVSIIMLTVHCNVASHINRHLAAS